MIFEVTKELNFHKMELQSINKMGKKKGVELAQKAQADAKIMYGKMLILHGQGSDHAFKAEEEMKKSEKILRTENAFFKANIAFYKAEKEVVMEKKAKKRALVAETRSQLMESKSLYKFTKQFGSKYMLKYVRREIRGNRKDIGKITLLETAKHKYLKSTRKVHWAFAKSNKRLVRIVQAKFRKEKRIYRSAVKAGRRRATKKAKIMLQAIKAGYDRTMTKIMKVKIKESREKVKFSRENMLIAKKDGNVEEIIESKKAAKKAIKLMKTNKKAKKSMDKQTIIKQNIQIAGASGKSKGIRKIKKQLRRERKKYKRADKKQIKVDLKEALQSVKDAREELEDAEIDEIKDDIKKCRSNLKTALKDERSARVEIFLAKANEKKKDYLEAKEELAIAEASGRKSVMKRARAKMGKRFMRFFAAKKRSDKIKIMLVKKQIRMTRNELRIARRIGDLSAVDQ